MNEDNKFKDKEVSILKDEEEILLDHNYDGIKELDNPLPMWWLWTFFLAIIFSFMYFIHYHLGGGGLSSDEDVALGIKNVNEQRAAAKAQIKTLSREEFQKLLTDQNVLAQGQELFSNYCASCHGVKGEGNIGPNLTDDYWKMSQPTLPEISKLIRSGIANTGMPPWEAVLNNDQITQVTVYVRSLLGSSPPNAKQPEGQKISIE